MAGNFMGDHVKGRDFTAYPERVAMGIRLHRQIDTYTDQHAIVLLSKERLRPVFRKYAPVVADMYYDHLLASQWHRFADEPLPAFAQRMYEVLSGYTGIMPERTNRFLGYMTRYDWLTGYGTIEGLHEVFVGMANRTRFRSHMELAAEFLEKHYDAFNREFDLFFPDLSIYVEKELSALR